VNKQQRERMKRAKTAYNRSDWQQEIRKLSDIQKDGSVDKQLNTFIQEDKTQLHMLLKEA
jgi:hypothetical protein